MTQPFHGWLELMGAINTLRGWENPAPDERLTPQAPFHNLGREHHRDPGSALNP
jgi:hypothetical protein